MRKVEKSTLPFATKLCYGIGALGYGSISQSLGNFIMFFGTSVMGISGSLVGIAVAISSLWDGISDPLVGYLSDNTKSKFFGKRLGFMFFGAILIAFFNLLIWVMPSSASQSVKFCWLLLILLCIETANTLFSTPFSALGIDLAPDYNEQARLQGYKTAFGIVGDILPSIFLYLFMPSISIGIQTTLSQSGYIKIALINSSLVLICGFIAIGGCIKQVRKRQVSFSAPREKFNLAKLLGGYFEVLKKRNFRIVILGYSVATIASAFLMSVGMHLFTYCYHFSSLQISLLMICLFGGAIASQLIWTNLSKRIDKKQALIIALTTILFGIGLTVITFLFRSFVDSQTMFYFVAMCIILCGIGLGAMQSLPMSMYADVVSMEIYRTGKNNAGSYTGYYTFTYNLANSIALLVIGFLLDFIKFDASQPLQAVSVQNGLGTIVFCGCGVALALSIWIFSKYSIRRADVLKTQIRLTSARKV